METYMNLNNLSVGYNKTPLIKDINVDIKKGEIVVLIGPNGAGKSTILKSITRHLRALSGLVTVEGENLFTMNSKKMAKTMSVVLTDRIHPELMTCRDVVAMGRYPYTNGFGKLTEDDERILTESLEKVHAVELGDRDFNHISDGQRQRIMLARAICQQPDIMILDEPTSFLDIRYKVDLLNILRQMASEGMTIIMSLHEIEMAYKVADKIICVKGDRISMAGTPQEVFADDKIAQIFELSGGEYNQLLGSVELKKPEGTPKTLIIGGNGTGINTYRQFQRQGIPFYAGMLFENDLDLSVAKALAYETVVAEPFDEVSASVTKRMYEILEEVTEVIDCGCKHGAFDRINEEILAKAKEMKKWKRIEK